LAAVLTRGHVENGPVKARLSDTIAPSSSTAPLAERVIRVPVTSFIATGPWYVTRSCAHA